MKVLVCGAFPHSGTTVLQVVMRRCRNVFAPPGETETMTDDVALAWAASGKEHLVLKTPWASRRALGSAFDGWTKVVILRDPRYIFSSLNRRFHRPGQGVPTLPLGHRVGDYAECLERVCRVGHRRDVIVVKYDDLFDTGSCQGLAHLLDSLGMDHVQGVAFQGSATGQPFTPPPPSIHVEYRSWQVSRPVRNMNDPDRIDLTPAQWRALKRLPTGAPYDVLPMRWSGRVPPGRQPSLSSSGDPDVHEPPGPRD
jgi:hypothetical protein